MLKRNYTWLDECILQMNDFIVTVTGKSKTTRAYPANEISATLSSQEIRHSAGYMRVNHSGEVCAQGLYRGQAVMARADFIRETLQTCAREETDHLAWCQQRLQELNSHRSYLDFFWYVNSFLMGMLAGMAGDQWSLGFIEETEKQVEVHLNHHLKALPKNDEKSRAVVKQMQQDEIKHAKTAAALGAVELPFAIKKIMAWHAKVMTTLAYYV